MFAVLLLIASITNPISPPLPKQEHFDRIHIFEIKNNRPQLGGFFGASTFYTYVVVTQKRDKFWMRWDNDAIDTWQSKPRVIVNRDGSHRVIIGKGSYRRQLTTRNLIHHKRIKDLPPQF